MIHMILCCSFRSCYCRHLQYIGISSNLTLLLLSVNQRTKRMDAPVVPFDWMPQSFPFALMMAGVFSQNVSKDLSDPRDHPVKRDNRNIQSKGIRTTGASIKSKGTTGTSSSKGQLESMQSKCW